MVFALLYLTGGGDSPYYLFYPLIAVNAYYFGRWPALLLTALAGLSYWGGLDGAAARRVDGGGDPHGPGRVARVRARPRRRPRAAWRAEVERLNDELTATLTRLQARQEELVVAERMATVGRLSLKVAHEVRNPIAAIGLNAEILGDIVRGRDEPEMAEAGGLVAAIREQVVALDALTEEYLAFARFPRPQFEEDSVNEMVRGGDRVRAARRDPAGHHRASRAPMPRCRRWPSTGRCSARPCSTSSRTGWRRSRRAARSRSARCGPPTRWRSR